MSYQIADPQWFVLLILPIGLVVWYWLARKREPVLNWEGGEDISNKMIFGSPEVLRHATIAGLSLLMIWGIALIAGLVSPGSKVQAPARTETASICFIIVDNSGSMSYSNEPGGESRDSVATRDLVEGVKQSTCQKFGLVSFDASSEALIAPDAGLPVSRDEVIENIEGLQYQSGGTAIGEGIARATEQCKLGAFGPCNFLLVSDLNDRSGEGQTGVSEAIQELTDLGASLNVLNVGAEEGYTGEVRWDTPQTALEGVEVVSSSADALTDVSEQSFTVPGLELEAPDQVPLLPRLIGVALLVLLVLPFLRTIRE